MMLDRYPLDPLSWEGNCACDDNTLRGVAGVFCASFSGKDGSAHSGKMCMRCYLPHPWYLFPTSESLVNNNEAEFGYIVEG